LTGPPAFPQIFRVKPFCTLIIPTIGRPKYFGPALASAAAQTYQPLEILVSDNAADPPITRAEIEKWAPNADVRLIRRPQRLDAAVHANLCLQDARGEYFFGLSDDDLISPRFISAAMDCILSDPQVAVVVTRQIRIDESFLGPVTDPSIHFTTMGGGDYVAQWIREGIPDVFTMTSMLTRRRALLDQGGFPNYPIGAASDNMVVFRLCLGAKIGILDGGYYYRVYPASTGLAMTWRELVLALDLAQRDYLALYQGGRLDRRTFLAIVRGELRFLLNRWWLFCRQRPGFENKVQPLLDVIRRTFQVGHRYGVGAIPILHKLFTR
jgi:glycosyltransferase involved in cell wall biosynthesis